MLTFTLPVICLVAGLVLAVGAVLGRVSSWAGLPSGLLFLGAGMFLGEDGPGGIDFQDWDEANAIGTLALGLILFHGGLSTPLDTIRRAWAPASVLATLGVIGVAGITALAAWGSGLLPVGPALLLGAILGSTDAAAVFDLLSGRRLKGRAREIIEVESGLNDPMAFVLVFAFTDFVVADQPFDASLLLLLVRQLVIGGLVGILVGFAASRLLRMGTSTGPALYPALTIGTAFVAMGVAGVLSGSILLAAYGCGIVLGNRGVPFRATAERVHDTLAWVAQVSMFLMLGLLVTPHELPPWILPGIAVAVFVALVARPLVVGLVLACFRVPWRENLLVAFCGLRGAVPIILATYPLVVLASETRGEIAGDLAPRFEGLFGMVFVAVAVGTFLPGALVRPVTRLLDMDAGSVPTPSVDVDLVTGGDIRRVAETFRIGVGSAAAGSTISELRLPADANIMLVMRDGTALPPRGATRLGVGDDVVVLFDPKETGSIEGRFTVAPEGRRPPGSELRDPVE